MTTPSVLILDDDPLTLEILKKDTGKDFFPVCAADFEKFQELIRERQFDLVITDLFLGTHSGLDVIRFVKKNIRYQSIPVILITGVEDDVLLEQCILSGADSFFIKPASPVLLRARMSELLERRKKQENLIDRNQALRDLYLSREEFIARVSHEFKTPIHAILGYISLLIHKGVEPLSEKQRSFLERVEANAKILLELITQTLNYKEHENRQNQINLELVNLKNLVGDVLHNWQSLLIENQIETEFHCELSGAMVLMDKEKFRLILSNLLSNAIKATRNGKIQIQLKGGRSEGKNYLLLQVLDTGDGMEDELKDRIYRLFYSSREIPPLKGMGIGLQNIKKNLEILSGSFYFESKKGEGSKFVLGFPLD